MPTIFLTHIPDMLTNYYGERALAELRKLGDVRLNDTGQVLDAKALAQAAQGCEIIISDRQTAGPAEFFPLVDDLVAFLRVAVDIRNVDVAAASDLGNSGDPRNATKSSTSGKNSAGAAVCWSEIMISQPARLAPAPWRQAHGQCH